MKKILRKNQIMITALAVMIAVAGYLNFAGTKIGEEDFISVDGSNSELTYEISDEDMYAISLREDTDGVITDYSEYAAVTGTEADIASLDTDDTTITDNYLKSDMDTQIAANTDENGATVIEQETPGEAVFTSASGVSTLAGAKLLKEQTRAQNKEALMEIINNGGRQKGSSKQHDYAYGNSTEGIRCTDASRGEGFYADGCQYQWRLRRCYGGCSKSDGGTDSADYRHCTEKNRYCRGKYHNNSIRGRIKVWNS